MDTDLPICAHTKCSADKPSILAALPNLTAFKLSRTSEAETATISLSAIPISEAGNKKGLYKHLNGLIHKGKICVPKQISVMNEQGVLVDDDETVKREIENFWSVLFATTSRAGTIHLIHESIHLVHDSIRFK